MLVGPLILKLKSFISLSCKGFLLSCISISLTLSIEVFDKFSRFL